MLSSQKTFDAIYDFAFHQEEDNLNRALQECGVSINFMIKTKNNQVMTPIMQLAFEGRTDAVRFLLSQGASQEQAFIGFAMANKTRDLDDLVNILNYLSPEKTSENSNVYRISLKEAYKQALGGFAIGGHSGQVDQILQENVNSPYLPQDIALAIKNYAIGGYDKEVDKLLKRYRNHPSFIDFNIAAAVGFAVNGNYKLTVALLLKRVPDTHIATNIGFIIQGYAMGGHIDHVEELLKENPAIDVGPVISNFAQIGHVDYVNKFLSESPSKEEAAIAGYRKGGHIREAELLENKNKDKNKVDSHIDQSNKSASDEEFEEMCRAINKIGDHIDPVKMNAVLKEIDVLSKYGKTLIEQGENSKDQKIIHKGKKAIGLASAIHAEVSTLTLNNRDTVQKKIGDMITSGRKAMGEDRKLKDIIGHILFAFTGIGLIIMLAKAKFTPSKSMFFNSTKRQKLVDNIAKEIQQVTQQPSL